MSPTKIRTKSDTEVVASEADAAPATVDGVPKVVEQTALALAAAERAYTAEVAALQAEHADLEAQLGPLDVTDPGAADEAEEALARLERRIRRKTAAVGERRKRWPRR